jgi:hypothetical protein
VAVCGVREGEGVMATVITWLDGACIQEDAEAHFQRIEAEKDAAKLRTHLANLRPMSQRHMRTAYVEAVERKEGKAAADKLRAAFVAEWDAKA